MKPEHAGFIPNDHWVECQRCGVAFRQSQVRKEWTGLIVCVKNCWESRHPQDFVRGRNDNIAPVGLTNPESADITRDQVTVSALAGVAIAGIAIAGVDPNSNDYSVPPGTF